MALSLSLACSECDRTQGLRDGSVPVEGASLTCIALPVEEIFHRMIRHAEFDAAELSLSSYVLSLDRARRSWPCPPFPRGCSGTAASTSTPAAGYGSLRTWLAGRSA